VLAKLRHKTANNRGLAGERRHPGVGRALSVAALLLIAITGTGASASAATPTSPPAKVAPDAPNYWNYVDRGGAYIHSCRDNGCQKLGGGRTVTGHYVEDRCFYWGEALEGNQRWHYVTDYNFSPAVSGWVHENWLLYTAPAGDQCW
jgi:hypothetical protein